MAHMSREQLKPLSLDELIAIILQQQEIIDMQQARVTELGAQCSASRGRPRTALTPHFRPRRAPSLIARSANRNRSAGPSPVTRATAVGGR